MIPLILLNIIPFAYIVYLGDPVSPLAQTLVAAQASLAQGQVVSLAFSTGLVPPLLGIHHTLLTGEIGLTDGPAISIINGSNIALGEPHPLPVQLFLLLYTVIH